VIAPDASRCRKSGPRMAANVAVGTHSDRRLLSVVAGVLIVPAAVLLVRVIHSGWLSSSDWADIELRTRDVGTVHTPLVGAYSRYGWNHPGPLLFYVLALPYRVLAARASRGSFGIATESPGFASRSHGSPLSGS
jgi:hypothetical protein